MHQTFHPNRSVDFFDVKKRSTQLRARKTTQMFSFENRIEKLREETPGCSNVIHLNNAGCSLPCKRVIEATEAFYRHEAYWGGYETVETCSEALQKPYDTLAALLNAHPDEIAIAPSATNAWQQVLFGFDFKPGDVILTTPNEYGSNFINFLQLKSRKDISIEIIPETKDGEVDLDQLETKLKQDKPKLLALTHVPTSSGCVYDAESIGSLTRSYDVPFLLDACQSVGQMQIDVRRIQCDFLSATSRKFLRGPRGIGFLYASRSMRDLHEPAFLDVHGSEWTSTMSYRSKSDAMRYEQYELNFAAKAGFGVAVEYGLELGMEWIENRVVRLATFLRRELEKVEGVQVCDYGKRLCGIVSFSMDGYSAERVREFLKERNINVSVSKRPSTRIKLEALGLEAVVRVSVHYYNTEEEIEKCVDALKTLRNR